MLANNIFNKVCLLNIMSQVGSKVKVTRQVTSMLSASAWPGNTYHKKYEHHMKYEPYTVQEWKKNRLKFSDRRMNGQTYNIMPLII